VTDPFFFDADLTTSLHILRFKLATYSAYFTPRTADGQPLPVLCISATRFPDRL